jgi:hypothetical protein
MDKSQVVAHIHWLTVALAAVVYASLKRPLAEYPISRGSRST